MELQRLKPRREVTQQLGGVGEPVAFHCVRSRFDGSETICYIIEMTLGVGSSWNGET